MRLEAPLVGKREHLIVHTGRIADAEHIDAAINQFLGDPIDSHIALGTDQHLTLAAQRLVDGFDKGGGLARAWRAVHHSHILRPQHLVDGLFLRRIQIREMHRGEREGLCLLLRIEEIAQIAESALPLDGAIEGVEHRLVARLVEEELHAYPLSPLDIDELTVIRHGNNHSVACS